MRQSQEVSAINFLHRLFSRVVIVLPLDVMVKSIAIDVRDHAFDSGTGRMEHSVAKTDLGSDVSSELCCLGAKPQRWTPSLVTRLGVIPRL